MIIWWWWWWSYQYIYIHTYTYKQTNCRYHHSKFAHLATIYIHAYTDTKALNAAADFIVESARSPLFDGKLIRALNAAANKFDGQRVRCILLYLYTYLLIYRSIHSSIHVCIHSSLIDKSLFDRYILTVTSTLTVNYSIDRWIFDWL